MKHAVTFHAWKINIRKERRFTVWYVTMPNFLFRDQIHRHNELKNVAAVWPAAGKVVVQQVRNPEAEADRKGIPPFCIKIKLAAHAALFAEQQLVAGIHSCVIIKEIASYPQEVKNVTKSPIGVQQRHVVVTRKPPHAGEIIVVVAP